MEALKKYRYLLYLTLLFVIPLGIKWVFKSYIRERYYSEKTILKIPAIHSNLFVDTKGRLFYKDPANGTEYRAEKYVSALNAGGVAGNPTATANGVVFDFDDKDFEGTLFYGLIPHQESFLRYPVFFKQSEKISKGKTEVDILTNLSGLHDISGWQKSGLVRLGYRVATREGKLLYDGKINLQGFGPFKIHTTLTEGPFVQSVGADSAIIIFTTNRECRPHISINNQIFQASTASKAHEITLKRLMPDSLYEYVIHFDNISENFLLRTFPSSNFSGALTFAFASDSRKNQGGGERDISGTNAYMMKRLAALAHARGARFFQFTGDMIDGYLPDVAETQLQYANWKRAIEPYASILPFFVGMGNHEVVTRQIEAGQTMIAVDRFPYTTESSEALFAASFCNPPNGPRSEDISAHDSLFPSYLENVYWYQCGEVAMVVLNSNYWYNVYHESIPLVGGNPHGYVMDTQTEWLRNTIRRMESSPEIRHIFVSIHTPFFPNGGHADDDMWYNGNNTVRPFIAGKAALKGILERRDELLDIIVNQSSKTRAILCGDEHNYSRLKLSDAMPRYPESYAEKKTVLKRDIWQITNGSAGAPYYGQEQLPWSTFVQKFSTQYALCLFHVHGDSIVLEVVNPDTLELIEKVILN
jgi:hypothetical protein